jgi:hypothetical protein
VACNFETVSNKIKLLTEYGSVTQKVLLFIESMLQDSKQLLSWHVSYPSGIQFTSKCIGHGIPDHIVLSI